MKINVLVVTLTLSVTLSTSFGQSKKEMEEFIVQDLKSYAGTYTSTWEGKLAQKETNYVFSIQNCDLIITSRYFGSGSEGNAKVIIPIADISEVRLIPKEKTGVSEISTRLQIKTSGHTMKRFWNGKMINMGDSEIIGLDSWTNDLGDKYKSVFKEFSKYCN